VKKCTFLVYEYYIELLKLNRDFQNMNTPQHFGTSFVEADPDKITSLKDNYGVSEDLARYVLP